MIMGPYIAEYKVDYSCQIEEPSVDYFRALDLINHFDSGIGKM
ncbi:hypothetical protein PMIT1306_02348 [Prochlorococcus sp. MIT 1306]|nr:hypothetical protein PMIT1306_02348 [Prochlorococcus sp. MIT 1306]